MVKRCRAARQSGSDPLRKPMPRLTLFHTAGCHLCEEAETLIAGCLAKQGMEASSLRLIDIALDESLVQRYGVSIPVLHEDNSGRELNWPFGQDDILGLL